MQEIIEAICSILHHHHCSVYLALYLIIFSIAINSRFTIVTCEFSYCTKCLGAGCLFVTGWEGCPHIFRLPISVDSYKENSASDLKIWKSCLRSTTELHSKSTVRKIGQQLLNHLSFKVIINEFLNGFYFSC